MNKRIKRTKRIKQEMRKKDIPRTVFDDNGVLLNYRCPSCHCYLAIPAESVAFGCDFYCWNCGQKLRLATDDNRGYKRVQNEI